MSKNQVIYGNIVTMNEKKEKAEAMAIKDGKIAFVGSKTDAKSYVDSNTEVLDFGSKTIYPGFIDVHSHMGLFVTIMGGGPSFQYGDTYEKNIEDLIEYIKKNPGKEVYKAYGFMNNSKRGFPTHDMLDAIEIDGKKFDKPIIISEVSGHLSWLNKAAMDKFGVNKEMAKKYGEDVVPLDKNGEPIGCIKETPHYAVYGKLSVDLEETKRMLIDFQNIHLSAGYSMIGDCGIDEGAIPMVSAMGELAKEGKLKLKVRAYYQIFETCKEPLKEIDRAIEYAKKYNCDSFKIIGIKIFLDGANEGLTSWTINPYAGYKFNDKPYSGYSRWNYDRLDELAEIIKKANANGLSMELHAIGSGAARYALDAIEKGQAGVNNPDFRNAVSHLYYVDKTDIPRFKKLNVMPVVAPQWYIFDPVPVNAEKLIYGEPDYLNMGPLKSHLDAGSNLAFHSDGTPGAIIASLIFTAVNKYDAFKDPNMEPRNIKEKISAYDALKCLTSNSAYVLKEENSAGKLEIGKSGDFIVYDVDFTDENTIKKPETCSAIPVASYINGEKIFNN